MEEKSLFHAIKTTKMENSALDKASNSTHSEPRSEASSELREWPCKVLQTWLKTRGFTYSGLRKAELMRQVSNSRARVVHYCSIVIDSIPYETVRYSIYGIVASKQMV